MLSNLDTYSKRMARHLERNSMSFEAYILAMVNGLIRVDRFMVMAVSEMWNISISFISPVYSKEWNFYHDTVDPDIVLIMNGHQFFHRDHESTHYSSTASLNANAKKLGYDLKDPNVKILHGQTKGKKAGTQIFMLLAAEKCLRSHYDISNKLKTLKSKVNRCETLLEEVEEELCSMKLNKNVFRKFAKHMDQLTEQEREKPIDMRQFLTHDQTEEQSDLTCEESEQSQSFVIPQVTHDSLLSQQETSALPEISREDVADLFSADVHSADQGVISDSHSDNRKRKVEEDEAEKIKRSKSEVHFVMQVPQSTTQPIAPPSTTQSIATPFTTQSTVPLPKIITSRKSREARGPAPLEGRDNTRFYCDKCPKHFKLNKGLLEHQRLRCGKVDKNFKCDICQFEFYELKNLKEHLTTMHGK